ncbi:glycoside hydrolase superfamily [Blyttiomyces helicus]|uniref:cellulase n=1 Tax=Blyttiomyces helicus TaxID=388810 RepID=A0A4P9W5K5_9FUNG|nr:glycoside hydrolase superfamily [Blyttiomyces helicus]|eukprot:RKO85376.1 glycoside hydrolase superfamily [Blyttiomyces helicus]
MTRLASILLASLVPVSVLGKVALTGVSEAGLDFGAGNFPGNNGGSFFAPNPAAIAHTLAKGANTIRLPFLWERVQPSAGGSFDATYLGFIDTVIKQVTSAGAKVILDPHNYARYVNRRWDSNQW